MSSQGLNSLATIIKRLEAATSRLEDIAVAQSGGAISFPESKLARPGSTILASNPAAHTQVASGAGGAKFGSVSSDVGPDSVPPSVAAFDERVIHGKLPAFITQTEGLGQAKLVDQAKLVENLFKNNRAILLCASACMKPTDSEFGTMIKPFNDDLGAIMKIKDDMRGKEFRDWGSHAQTISDGAPCVGWIQVPAAPATMVKGLKEAAEFYGNKVIQEYREKDKKHVDWVRSYISLIDELHKYVLEYHKMGLIWNPKGGKAIDFNLASSAGPSGASTSGGPPPPPPPPPPPVLEIPSSSETSLTGTSAVFAELNKGSDVTKGLKKVDKSEMTHKNPSLRASGSVPGRAPSPNFDETSGPTPKTPTKPKKPASLQAKKPPKWELQGNKWVIEYHENERELILEDVSINQIVTLYGCKNTVLQIKGKVNGVSMTNCQKTSLVVDSAISVISITNSQSFQLQILGSAPTIQIETTDSGQVYLSHSSLNAEIITAKCSAINISVPFVGEEGEEFKESPVPEMLRTVVVDGKLVTNIVEHTS